MDAGAAIEGRLLDGAEAAGVHGDVVVVDVEGDGGGAAEEEADGELR